MRSSISRVGEGELQPPRVAVRFTGLTAATVPPLLVAAAYYVGAVVGFAIKFPSIPTSIVWPPNSILMAALMLTPARRWWVYLLAALPAHLLIQSRAAVPLPAILFLFLTNAGEAALGAYAVRRLCGGPPRFGYVRDVVIFFVFAVFAAPLVTTFPDAAAVVMTKWGDDYSLIWQARFCSNVLTVLTLVPAIVMWAANGRAWLRELTLRRFAEGCLLALGLGVAYAAAYSAEFGPSFAPALLYAPLPFLMWAALRFGAGGASTSLLAVLLISVSYAICGRGPFNSQSPATDVVGLQLFLIAISVPVMMLAAVTEERGRAAEALKESEARNRAILQAVPDLMFLQTRDGVYLDFHARDTKDLYVPPEQFIGKSVRDVLPPELAERFLNSFRIAGESGEPQVIEYALTLEGQERYFEARIVRSHEHVLSVVRDLTERKRTDAVVTERDQLLQAVFSSLSAHVVVLDRGGLITYASRSWIQFAVENHGRLESVSVGVNYLEVCRRAAREGAENASEVLQGINAVMSREQPTFVIEYSCHAPGKRRWFLMHVDPMPAEHGGVVVSHIDITERKLAEATLKLQSRMLDTIEQSAIATDLDGVIFFWNQCAERLYGWSKEEAIGRPVSDLLYFADNEEMIVLAEDIWSELREGGSWVGEFAMRRRDGTTLQVWVNDSPIIDEKGNVVGIIGISHEITERKRAEEALRESEERFRNMANNAPVVIWVTEPDGSCTFASQTWRDLTGQAPETGLGFGWAEWVHPADRARTLATFFAANERREAFRLDYRLQGKDGAFLWVIVSGVPRFSSQGEFLGYIGSLIDITERKRAQQALEQLTGRLLQLQDEERRRLARELHDTTAQNLLAIVLNLETLVRMASTLPKDFSDAVLECQSLCEQTQAEIRTLSYLLHPPMLDEAGLPLALEWFIEGFSRRSGIHVDFVAPPDFRRLPPQMETTLFRVVQESLTNIYRHSGSTTAEISLERAGGEVCLRVTDRGRGITAASGDGAVPPGKRAENLGVGISGMRERLRQIGGHLEVRSDGAETSVTAVLPLGKGEDG